MKPKRLIAVALTWLMMAGLGASAEARVSNNALHADESLQATSSYASLTSGFTPNPYRVEVMSRGGINAGRTSGDCAVSVSRKPDFQLNYEADNLPLTFGVDSDVEYNPYNFGFGVYTTLVINGPDGRWVCDEDSGDQGNPELTYGDPQSGLYDVWIGASDGKVRAFELFVSQQGGDGARSEDMGQGAAFPTPPATATYGEIGLVSGFTAPHQVFVWAGGSVDASSMSDDCAGMIARNPSFKITNIANALPLIIAATSDGDVTLVINAPDGNWYCDDDSGDGFDAAMVFRDQPSGVYDIWVGSIDGEIIPAELFITQMPR